VQASADQPDTNTGSHAGMTRSLRDDEVKLSARATGVGNAGQESWTIAQLTGTRSRIFVRLATTAQFDDDIKRGSCPVGAAIGRRTGRAPKRYSPACSKPRSSQATGSRTRTMWNPRRGRDAPRESL
jgi:hypothetical protein